MPRLNVVNPETDSGPGADLLNGPLKKKQLNIFKGMANNAGVLKAFLGFSQGVKAGSLTDAEHEIVELVVAGVRKCEYCSAAHSAIAQQTGISEDDVLAIRKGDVADPKRQALIDFSRAIVEKDGFVSDDELAAFKQAGYDDAAVVEVLGEIAVATFTNFFNHVNETEVDFPVVAAV